MRRPTMQKTGWAHEGRTKIEIALWKAARREIAEAVADREAN